MPWPGRLAFAILLAISVFVPLYFPEAIGLGEQDRVWGMLIAAPICILTWLGAELDIRHRKNDEAAE